MKVKDLIKILQNIPSWESELIFDVKRVETSQDTAKITDVWWDDGWVIQFG